MEGPLEMTLFTLMLSASSQLPFPEVSDSMIVIGTHVFAGNVMNESTHVTVWEEWNWCTYIW